MMDSPGSVKFQDNPTVTLNVGPDRRAFHVHQELLFGSSPVFQAAFSGAYQESDEGCMALPEEDPETVERLMHWLYFRSLGLIKAVCSKTSNERFWQLARLSTLADKFNVEHLKNSIIDESFAMRKNSNVVPPTLLVIAYIYENTTETSSLRKLMVGWYAWHIKQEWYTRSGTPAHLERVPMFAADLAIAMNRRVHDSSLKSPFFAEPSSYYEDQSKRSGSEQGPFSTTSSVE